MSDAEFNDIDEPDDGYLDPQAVQRQRTRIKALEAEVKTLKPAAEAGELARRKLAFLEANVDLSDPRAKFFADHYRGELEPEAVKSAAIENGFLAPAEPEAPAADLEAHQRMSQLAAGGMTPAPGSDLAAQIANAQSEAELTALLVQAGKPVATTLHQQQ